MPKLARSKVASTYHSMMLESSLVRYPVADGAAVAVLLVALEVEPVEDVPDEASKTERPFPKAIIRTLFPILLMGVFLVNGDSSVVLATNQHIASEFDALPSAAWLLTAYTLAQCSSQPLYGKLGDIFGRNRNLAQFYQPYLHRQIGISRTYWQVLAGRAISGIGASGMVALTSIVVADLLPLSYVAQYRAYVNFTATMARSIGGPTGGWLAGSIGWRCVRWLCEGSLSFSGGYLSTISQAVVRTQKKRAKPAPNALASAFSGPLPWGYPGIIWYPWLAPFSSSQTTFVVVEKCFVKEPILPLQLMSKRDVFTPYLIIGCQSGGQFGLLYGIPIYFQVASGESVCRAGSRIVPVVISNASGTLLGGHLISKTKRYKYLTVLGICCSLACFALMCLRWHDATNWAESCYVYLAGFGRGTTQSSTFVHLAASLDHSDIAIAGTTWFLSQSFGSLVGAGFATSLMNGILISTLEKNLTGSKDKVTIIRRVTSSVASIHKLPERLQKIVANAYITSLLYSDGESFEPLDGSDLASECATHSQVFYILRHLCIGGHPDFGRAVFVR
ncbi:uncharacterized protein Z519_00268 [Cladophialophora bantiana CBS 173.52]|uniref:Major facilitator superfamily (MFS) profile domain-containing protein n=1 Tax=Cladophialophora bantiana (strain ATCC 10958 / CBS 173.52 / CDC B-1940 / NIH 8579) TaxID=1442370 RepID=A0A0D2GJM2_CLAB1|nr:uncharacterized protein Z519_00268 [Cladophialophora bantiana CBS 173.52]KIW98607.1 hypothetical protein Z519_00268 [Cladophialophora bantiana CBS 173.52]